MTMQVGLKSAAGLQGSPLSSTGLAPSSSVRDVAAVTLRQNDRRYPESPLISARPLRYNVYLNQQITAVQQADSYLAKLENELLSLRFESKQRRVEASAQSVRTLSQLLTARPGLSGGTVDRNFIAQPEQPSAVSFTLPAAQNLLQGEEPEMLLFALSGARRALVAITFEGDESPRQVVQRLNQGLGRMGIHAAVHKQQLVFSVEEKDWQQISNQLSVRGEGKRFSAHEFTALIARPEPALTDSLERVVQQPVRAREFQGEVQQALEQLTQQRGQLHTLQERVRQRIDEMATQYKPDEARRHARALSEHLKASRNDYASTARALGAQANLQQSTVKNVLS